MRENHITHILDDKPIASLSEAELSTIRAHVATCVPCNRAYDAARLAAMLIKERAGEAVQQALNANPFFQTRVMAAWRERRETSVSALRRLWNATGVLVATMAGTTAALAVLTFAVPATDSSTRTTAALVPYSAESVMLDQSDKDQVTDDQVINAMYADDDEDK